MKTYEGDGTIPTVWTGPCPHLTPGNRVIPDADSPEWVQKLVRPPVRNSDNGQGAGICGGDYYVVNGKPGSLFPAWVPDGRSGICPGEDHGGRYPGEGPLPIMGHMLRTVCAGDLVERVHVEIAMERTPSFPLPRVVHFPGYGLAVEGPEVTSSENGVRARFKITMG